MIKINISELVSRKMQILTNYNYEIAWYLLGKIKDGEFYIYDLLIPPQEASSAQVEIDIEGMSWVLKNYKDKLKDLIGHGHSHHSMTAFYSPGDEANMEIIMKGKKFFLFVVTAQSKTRAFDYVARVMLNAPFSIQSEAEIQLIEKDDKLKVLIDKEVSEKVKKKEYSSYSYWDKGDYWSGLYGQYGSTDTDTEEVKNQRIIANQYNYPEQNEENIEIVVTDKQLEIIENVLTEPRFKDLHMSSKISDNKEDINNLWDVTIQVNSKKSKKRFFKQLNYELYKSKQERLC